MTVEELRERMSNAEYHQWRAYYEIIRKQAARSRRKRSRWT